MHDLGLRSLLLSLVYSLFQHPLSHTRLDPAQSIAHEPVLLQVNQFNINTKPHVVTGEAASREVYEALSKAAPREVPRITPSLHGVHTPPRN
jgi:hypothetical protein